MPDPWQDPQQDPVLPYGAVEQAPPTGGAAAPAGPGAPGATGPTPWYGDHRPPAAARRKRRSQVVVLAVFALLVLVSAVAGTLSNLSGGDDDDDAGAPTPAPPVAALATTWVLTPAEIAPGLADAEMVFGLDGAFTGSTLTAAGDVWVVGVADGAHVPQHVAGIDADTGALLWTRALPSVLCADEAADGALACVSDAGSTWTYHRLSLETGEDLATSDTGLKEIQAVHAAAGALVVVGPAQPAPNADLAAFGPDGDQLWSLDVADLPGSEVLFDNMFAGNGGSNVPVMERLRWRDLADGRVMLWSTPGVAIIDAAGGDVVVHECRRATPAGDHYFCADDAGINRRTLDGEVVWTLPDLDLASPADVDDARPMAVAGPDEAVAVDWETGTALGPAYARFDLRPGGFTGTVLPPSAAGDAQQAFLHTQVVALEPDVDAVAWSHEIDEGYLSGVVAIQDVVILDDYPLVGLDAATGEPLWERTSPVGLYLQVDGDRLGTLGFDEVALLELP